MPNRTDSERLDCRAGDYGVPAPVRRQEPICGYQHNVGSQYLLREMARKQTDTTTVNQQSLRVWCCACGKEWWFPKPMEADDAD